MSPSTTYNEDIVHNVKKNSRNNDKVMKAPQEADAGSSNKVLDFIHSARGEISHAAETVSKHVHEKPMQSSIWALGVGLLLGVFMRR